MNFWWEEVLKCPVCGAATEKKENSLYCLGARRHCFDFSAKGYLNLADSRAAGGGDDAELIAARGAFLARGFYAPIASRVCELLGAHLKKESVVIDAGCGEGYYTCRLSEQGYRLLGIDLSKRGITAGARAAKNGGLSALFAVAGIFSLPVQDACADAVVSLFAPVAEAEFLRVLRKGGYLLTVGAGPTHLYELKSLLYDTPYENEQRKDAPVKMRLVCEERLRFEMRLDREDAKNLFAMTPYYYRTSKTDAARLDAVTSLSCGADVTLSLYRKEE